MGGPDRGHAAGSSPGALGMEASSEWRCAAALSVGMEGSLGGGPGSSDSTLGDGARFLLRGQRGKGKKTVTQRQV